VIRGPGLPLPAVLSRGQLDVKRRSLITGAVSGWLRVFPPSLVSERIVADGSGKERPSVWAPDGAAQWARTSEYCVAADWSSSVQCFVRCRAYYYAVWPGILLCRVAK
jgi:hypothetical protein